MCIRSLGLYTKKVYLMLDKNIKNEVGCRNLYYGTDNIK